MKYRIIEFRLHYICNLKQNNSLETDCCLTVAISTARKFANYSTLENSQRESYNKNFSLK